MHLDSDKFWGRQNLVSDSVHMARGWGFEICRTHSRISKSAPTLSTTHPGVHVWNHGVRCLLRCCTEIWLLVTDSHSPCILFLTDSYKSEEFNFQNVDSRIHNPIPQPCQRRHNVKGFSLLPPALFRPLPAFILAAYHNSLSSPLPPVARLTGASGGLLHSSQVARRTEKPIYSHWEWANEKEIHLFRSEAGVRLT